MICGTRLGGGQKEVKSARGIEAFYMYFNGTGIWGGETTSVIFVLYTHICRPTFNYMTPWRNG